MTCCNPTIIPFTGHDEMTIPYSTAMRALYGDVPTVYVYHLDNGEYIKANIRIAFIGVPATEIKIYNGGLADGFVKIMK